MYYVNILLVQNTRIKYKTRKPRERRKMLAKSSTVISQSIVGQKFQRRNQNVYITVIQADEEKTKTCLVEFNTGRTMKLSISTLKDANLWVPFEGRIPDPEPPEPETYVAGTDTQEGGKGMTKPIPEERRKVSVSKPKQPKAPAKYDYVPVYKARPNDANERLYTVLETLGCEYKINPKKERNVEVRYMGKPLVDVYLGDQTFTVAMREELAMLPQFKNFEYRIRKNTIYPYFYIAKSYETFNEATEFIIQAKKLLEAKLKARQERLEAKEREKERKRKEKEEKKNGKI